MHFVKCGPEVFLLELLHLIKKMYLTIFDDCVILKQKGIKANLEKSEDAKLGV